MLIRWTRFNSQSPIKGTAITQELNEKGCEYGRVLKRRVDNMEDDVAEVIENLQDRPSWSIALLMTTMSSIIVGLSVALIAGW